MKSWPASQKLVGSHDLGSVDRTYPATWNERSQSSSTGKTPTFIEKSIFYMKAYV